MKFFKPILIAIGLLYSATVYGGDYDCTGVPGCIKSCVSIGDCQHPCVAHYNPECTIPPEWKDREMIQGCELIDIRNLGYTKGNKHQFCLDKGWNGGEVAGHCWKKVLPEGCSRLAAYYNCIGTNGSRCCDHLTGGDSCILGVCTCF